jgi:alcohol dehydrogenase class IV
MTPFDYTAAPARVVFGAGSLRHLVREIEALGARRALILSTPEQRGSAQRVAELLGSRAAGVYAEARMHVPIETARGAREEARRVGADCAVAIGGGSTTGLGKAIALDVAADASRFPILAIPTTYAGSEMTPIWGLTEAGVKKTGRDPRVLPVAVIYDPELTLTLPLGLTVTSALNAIAHAAEGLYAHDGNPVMSLMAEEGIRAAASALGPLMKNARDPDARSDALYAAWLCGTVLGNVAMGLHHKLCHTLGGTFELPHAEVHTVVLPHALAYNAAAAPRQCCVCDAQSRMPAAPRRARRAPCSTSRATTARPPRCARSACRWTASIAPPISRCRTSTRTRGRSSVPRFRELLQRAYEGARPD